MAARPSPLAIKLQKQLDRALTNGELAIKQRDEANAALAEVNKALAEQADAVQRFTVDTNNAAGLEVENRTLRQRLDACESEIGFLRTTLNRVTMAGVFVSGVTKL